MKPTVKVSQMYGQYVRVNKYKQIKDAYIKEYRYTEIGHPDNGFYKKDAIIIASNGLKIGTLSEYRYFSQYRIDIYIDETIPILIKLLVQKLGFDSYEDNNICYF